MLAELVTEAGGQGRTYSTTRVFKMDGVLVATMNQQCIVRSKAEKTAKPKL